MKLKILFVLIALSLSALKAQQASLSAQYDAIAGIYNPAYNGVNTYLKVDAISRLQWAGMPGAPRYTGLNLQTPVSRDFAIGANFQSLQVGNFKYVSPLSMNQFAGDIAYHKQLSKNVNVSVGLRLGIFNFNLQVSRLIADNPEDIALAGNDYNINTPIVGGGTMMYGKNYFLGFSMPQMAIVTDNILNNVNLGYNARPFYLFSAGYIYPFKNQFSLKTTVQSRFYKGLAVQSSFNIYGVYKDAFMVGYGYRTSGAHCILANVKVNDYFKILYAFEMGSIYSKNITYTSNEFGLTYAFNQPKQRTIIVPRLY